MEEQSSVDVSGRPKLQRYPLRSASRSKEQKPDASVTTNPSQSKRGRSTANVSQSVGVLDFSSKDRSSSAKPPRRLSNLVKASATLSPKAVGNITPISETRSRRSGNSQEPQTRTRTPVSKIFRSSTKMKFSLLSSASYWLSQIKLSENVEKHNISLGFFKLALEAGCEPFQKLQDELKSYLHRHQQKLTELGEPVKELVESYNIAEVIEQSQVSESISQMLEEETHSSDDEGHFSTSSTMANGKLTPKCLNAASTQVTSPVKTIESPKKETSQKKNLGSMLRENLKMNSAISKSASGSLNCSRSVKKSDKPSKLETNKSGVKKYGRKADAKEVFVSPTSVEEKENMDVRSSDDDLIEVL